MKHFLGFMILAAQKSYPQPADVFLADSVE